MPLSEFRSLARGRSEIKPASLPISTREGFSAQVFVDTLQQIYPALLASGSEILQIHPAPVGAEDLVQEAITRWMESGKVLSSPGQMRRWLRTSMKHIAIDWCERSRNPLDGSLSLETLSE